MKLFLRIDFYIGFCDEKLSMKTQIRKDCSFKPQDVIGIGIGMFGNPLSLKFFSCQNGQMYCKLLYRYYNFLYQKPPSLIIAPQTLSYCTSCHDEFLNAIGLYKIKNTIIFVQKCQEVAELDPKFCPFWRFKSRRAINGEFTVCRFM